MAKQLFLIRHAETSPVKPGSSDFKRTLTTRGWNTSAALGQRMRQKDHVPAFVFCSTAYRARQTWEAISENLGGSPETAYLPELYRADASDYRILLATAPTEEALALVGHNPAIWELALSLAGSGEADVLAALHSGFPAGALAILEFTEPWWRLSPRSGTLRSFIPPLL